MRINGTFRLLILQVEPESDEFSEGGTWQPKQPKFSAARVPRNAPRTGQVDDSVTEPESEPSDWMDPTASVDI